MQRILFPAALVLLAAALMACSSAGNGKPKTGNGPVPDTSIKWKVVSAGSQSAMEQPAQLVVKDQATFDSLWQTAFRGVDVPLDKPMVDYKTNWLIAAFKGTCTSGGHTIDIRSVSRTGKGILVTILQTKPAAGCMTTTMMEYPYIMVTIPVQANAGVEFAVVSEDKHCE